MLSKTGGHKKRRHYHTRRWIYRNWYFCKFSNSLISSTENVCWQKNMNLNLISGFKGLAIVIVEPCIHLPPYETPLLKARQEQCSTNKHLMGWPNYRLAPCLYICVLGMREDWHQVEEHGVSWEGTSSPPCPLQCTNWKSQKLHSQC